MYCMYQDREELEDELYREDDADSEGSEVNSELEFRLYSQLHYSSNSGDVEEQEERGEEEEKEGEKGLDKQQSEVMKTTDGETGLSGESRPQSPDESRSQQHPKIKKKKKIEKQEKERRQKSILKSSSPGLVEVIVIDSSPDVISISEGDTSDHDEGVCASKGQGQPRLKTSTPARKETQKSKQRVSVPVTVVPSSSESDSDSSQSDSDESDSDSDESDSGSESDSSDSDGLENWMILGGGKQDGDHSIALNLKGGSDRNSDAEEDTNWSVSEKDKEAQIYNKERGARMQRLSNRYYTDKSVQCRNCNKRGHLSKNCPEPKKVLPCYLCGTPGHVVSECPSRHCNNCGLPGHLYDSCNERPYWHKQCYRCNMTGHFFDACPEIWRQYHITTKPGVPVRQHGEDRGRSPAYCHNCSRKGHFGHACTRQRMFKGTYPCTPFINHYDTLKDIKILQHRSKVKVRDLKSKGLIPATSEAPLTPGPPKKKQKLNHHKNNHTPHHDTPKHNHKPSPSHIFFKDSHNFEASGPRTKKNKYKQQESTSNVKPWKPKRPVPLSKDPPPRLVIDEADDFPRGGSKGENTEMKKRKKKIKRKRMSDANQTPSGTPGKHRDSGADKDIVFVKAAAPGSKKEKGEKKRNRRDRRDNNKKQDAHLYPTDENLFIIKQRRKRSR